MRAAPLATHEIADYYAAILDRLKGRCNALSPSGHKTLLLGLLVTRSEARLPRSLPRFLKLSNVESLGYIVAALPVSSDANALTRTPRSTALDAISLGNLLGIATVNVVVIGGSLSISKRFHANFVIRLVY